MEILLNLKLFNRLLLLLSLILTNIPLLLDVYFNIFRFFLCIQLKFYTLHFTENNIFYYNNKIIIRKRQRLKYIWVIIEHRHTDKQAHVNKLVKNVYVRVRIFHFRFFFSLSPANNLHIGRGCCTCEFELHSFASGSKS